MNNQCLQCKSKQLRKRNELQGKFLVTLQAKQCGIDTRSLINKKRDTAETTMAENRIARLRVYKT